MRAGKLVQHDTPAEILSHPADDFVANFIGADGPLKRLGLIRVETVMSTEAPEGIPARLLLGASLRDALTAMIASNSDAVAIEDGAGALQGYVHRKAIFAA